MQYALKTDNLQLFDSGNICSDENVFDGNTDRIRCFWQQEDIELDDFFLLQTDEKILMQVIEKLTT